MEITKEIAKKVLTTVDAGLCSGIGKPEPGKMCVEAAVCYAMGLPHSDEPPCVGRAVRSFKIRLNDSCWLSDAARAKGMRKIAIAQLGSDAIDQKVFAEKLALKTCQKIVPLALRAAVSRAKEPHKAAMEAAAVKCEGAKTTGEAREFCEAARKDARAAAADDAAAAAAARDKTLTLMADLCLEVLVEMKSPGCEWLDLAA